MVTAATSDGRQRSYAIRFTRRLFGRFRFEPTTTLEGSKDFYLEPVRRVWRQRQKAEG